MPNPDGTATIGELVEFWEDVLEAEGLPQEPVEKGHEDDVLLEDVDQDTLRAAAQRFEAGG